MDKAYEDSLKIWKDTCEFKSLNKNLKDEEFEAEIKAFHEKITSQYPDFCYTFPIVCKLIVLSSMYDPKTMKTYLEYYSSIDKKDIGNFEEFVKHQAEYVYYYWKRIYSTPRPGMRKLGANQIEQLSIKEKNKIKDDLLSQFNKFKDICDQTMKDDNDKDLNNKKEKLKNFIANHVN